MHTVIAQKKHILEIHTVILINVITLHVTTRKRMAVPIAMNVLKEEKINNHSKRVTK